MKRRLTRWRIMELLDYDPATGLLTWKSRRHNHIAAGTIAGTVDTEGYRHIRIGAYSYVASHLIMRIMTGQWSRRTVDHKDTDPTNDRWNNLRPATQKQQIANRHGWGALGAKGVYFSADGKRKKRFRVPGIGRFTTLEEAQQAAMLHIKQRDKQFARTA